MSATTHLLSKLIRTLRQCLAGHRDRWHVMLLASLLSLGVVATFFMSIVLDRPAKTPIVTLTGMYGPNWDINPWVEEDLNSIRSLQAGPFAVHELPGPNRLMAGFWDQADTVLRDAMLSTPVDQAVLVYVNLHGAVDDQGRACLIPPDAETTDSSTWLPIQTLIDHLMICQPDIQPRPIVMMLESGRLRSHWAAGLIENNFDERLATLTNDHRQRYPESQLTIISSAGRGQRSHASRLGSGSVFTRKLAEGLAGKADGKGDTSREDGCVDSGELFDFVRDEVARWARHHRSADQRPRLHRAGARSVTMLARVGDRSYQLDRETTEAPQKEDVDRLIRASRTLAELRDRNAIRFDANAWAESLATLHAIRQSTFGGQAARDAADRWYSRFGTQIQKLNDQIDATSGGADEWMDRRMARSAALIWTAIAKEPSRETAGSLVDQLDDRQTSPVPMLVALLNCPSSSFWMQPKLIQRLAKAKADWLSVSLEMPDELSVAASELSKVVDIANRQVSDSILASRRSDETPTGGNSPNTTDSVENAINRYENQVVAQRRRIMDIVNAWNIGRQAIAEMSLFFPLIGHAPDQPLVTEPELVNGPAAVERLIRLWDRMLVSDDAWSSGLHNEVIQTSKSVQASLIAVKRTHAKLLASADRPAESWKGKDAGTLAMMSDCAALASDIDQQIRAEQTLRQFDAELCNQCDSGHAASSESDEIDAGNRDKLGRQCLAVFLGLDATRLDGVTIRKRLRTLLNAQSSSLASVPVDYVAANLIPNGALAATTAKAANGARQASLSLTAERVMDDFWKAPAAAGKPYFLTCGDRLLTIADSVADTSPEWKTRHDDLVARLRSRADAATTGLQVSATTQPTSSTIGTESRVLVEINGDVGSSGVPAGTARVSIGTDADGTDISVAACDLTTLVKDGDAREGSTAVSLISVQSQSDRVDVHFRGHQFVGNVKGSLTASAVTTTGVPADVPARVTVRSGLEDRQAICFVMDCSASMHDAAPVEVARSTPLSNSNAISSPQKIDAARSALIEMLRRIEPADIDVGLVLYGHRMAIGTGDQGLLLQKRYHKKFPFSPTLHPYEDVELAIPTGRFDAVELAMARQRLTATVPWGQTPLYLAIRTAIRDLARLGDQSAKDVIVISDGKNYQFNPSSAAILSVADVVSEAKAAGVRVHIVGLGIAADADDIVQQFQSITGGSGGETTTDVYRATDLLRQLEMYSASTKVEIEFDGEAPLRSALGTTVARRPESHEGNATNHPDRPSTVKVTLNGDFHVFPVSDGMHLQLIADPSGGTPKSVAYSARFPRFSGLRKPNRQPTAAKLGMHQPVASQDAVTFRFSIQGRQGQVPPRPGQVWVELSAIDETNSQPSRVYRTASVDWLPNLPCPVAQWKCLNWPTGATSYAARAWLGESLTDDVAKTVALDLSNNSLQPLTAYDGIRYRIKRHQDTVELTLEYELPDGAKNAWDADRMLMVDRPNSSGAGTTHWYDSERQISVHAFHGIEANDPEFSVRMTSISHWKNQSSTTSDPIEGQLRPSFASATATKLR